MLRRARNPRSKSPESGGGSTVETEGIPRHYLDAPPGDLPLNLDSRAFLVCAVAPKRILWVCAYCPKSKPNVRTNQNAPQIIYRHAKRLNVRCPWPVRGLNAVRTSSRNRTGHACDHGLDATVGYARKWIEHGFGQIAVAVSLGSEHGHVWGQVANADCARTPTNCGRGCDSQSCGQLPGLCETCFKHCVGNCVDDSSDPAWPQRGLQPQWPEHCADTDWLRTGHGLDAAPDIVPDTIRPWRGRYGRCCSAIARLVALRSCKGMVSKCEM